MPFLADDELLGLSDLVQSDLLNTVESPRDATFQTTAKADRSIIGSVAGASVVAIDNEGLNSSDDDGDIGGVEPNMPSSVPKKRGRPSLLRSETPAKPAVTKTPRSTKTAPTPKSTGTGRKRKAPEPEPEGQEDQEPEESSEETSEPAKKRGRPSASAAATATSARLAAKAASKPTRGRPKGSANTATKPAKGKGGRPKKESTNGDSTSAEEYEVEDIIGSMVDAETKEHFYFVKWKGYPASDNSWEPKSNLAHAAELMKAFDAKKKAEAAEKKAEDKAAAAAAKEKKAAAKEKKQPKEKKEKPAKAVGKAKAKKELKKEKPTRVSGRTRTTSSA
ncbi:hypothetical protein V8F33_003910 [Rhypophila sp. PSN 637]